MSDRAYGDKPSKPFVERAEGQSTLATLSNSGRSFAVTAIREGEGRFGPCYYLDIDDSETFSVSKDSGIGQQIAKLGKEQIVGYRSRVIGRHSKARGRTIYLLGPA